MNSLYKNLSAELEKKKIRPSIQRVAVLNYLINNCFHPTVDQIHKDLQSVVPTLSKTTIYNTLDLFAEAGLVRILTIEDNKNRYDIITEPHGHFKCYECSTIFNFTLDLGSIESKELSGFKVIDKDVYFKGVCLKCLLNINSNSRKE